MDGYYESSATIKFYLKKIPNLNFLKNDWGWMPRLNRMCCATVRSIVFVLLFCHCCEKANPIVIFILSDLSIFSFRVTEAYYKLRNERNIRWQQLSESLSRYDDLLAIPA